MIDFLFGPPSVELTEEEKSAILGDWRLSDGKVIRFKYDGDSLIATGLPFLSNTDPAREQLITPISGSRFFLRTMLEINLSKGAAGSPQLSIHKMRSDETAIATSATTPFGT